MSEAKKRLRADYRARRRQVSAKAAIAAAREISRRALTSIPWPDRAVIAGYWPFPDELDPRPLMNHLAARGCTLCLPVVVERDAALQFRTWAPGDPLVDSVFGTQVPTVDSPTVVPDILLVPLLAFDSAGYRLGYGGGYYDRTLAALESAAPLTIGLAFALQEVSQVPRDAYDRRLDWIVTETAVHQTA